MSEGKMPGFMLRREIWQWRTRFRKELARTGRVGIFGIDWLLRHWQGVRSYTCSDSALLRIAARQATARLTLADGTLIQPGDLIIELHIWNERVPSLGPLGRNLGWACRANRRIHGALRELAKYLESDAALRRYVAVRAEAFPVTERSARRLVGLAACLGLLPAADDRHAGLGQPDWGHGMLAWLLAWAWNPASLTGKKLRPFRHEFWMSAMELRARYLGMPAVMAMLLSRTGDRKFAAAADESGERNVEVGVTHDG